MPSTGRSVYLALLISFSFRLKLNTIPSWGQRCLLPIRFSRLQYFSQRPLLLYSWNRWNEEFAWAGRVTLTGHIRATVNFAFGSDFERPDCNYFDKERRKRPNIPILKPDTRALSKAMLVISLDGNIETIPLGLLVYQQLQHFVNYIIELQPDWIVGLVYFQSWI